MERETCGNCSVPLLDKASKRTVILSSWRKQNHPYFISIYEALAVVFEISPLIPNESDEEPTKKEVFLRGSKFGPENSNEEDNDSDEDSDRDRWGLCNNCSEILTIVYNNFQELTALCRAESEVAKIMKRLERARAAERVPQKYKVSSASRDSRCNSDLEKSVVIKSEPVDRADSDVEEDDINDASSYLDNSLKRPPSSLGAHDDRDDYDDPPSPLEISKENQPAAVNQDEEQQPTTASGRPRRNATKSRNISYTEHSSDSEEDHIEQLQLRRGRRRGGVLSSQNRPLPHHVSVIRSGGITIKQLKCPLCNKDFLHENVLICHRRIIHRENIKLVPPAPMPKLPFFHIAKKRRDEALQESAGKTSTCPVCHLEVPRIEIRNHLSKHTRSTSKPWMCTICGLECENHEAFIQHARTHQACIPCSRCGRRVSRLEMLSHLRHCMVTNATKSAYWSCKLCKIKFSHKSKMLKHMESHKQKKAHNCKICLKTFNSLAVLRLHVKRFHRNNENGPPSVRSIPSVRDENNEGNTEPDGEQTTSLGPPTSPRKRYQNRKSMQTDSSDVAPIIDNRFVCKACDYQCPDLKQMESHLRGSHANLSSLTCNICQRRLQDEYCLNLHLNSHADTKPMECYVCLKTYSQKNSFYFHLKERHSLETKTIVFKYPQLFSFANSVRGVRIRGQRIHTAPKKGEFPCDKCDKVFPYLHSVRSHQKFVHEKVREFICSYCGKSFPRKSYFLLHEKLHTSTETPYKCHLCSKGFRLPGNLRMHLQSTIHNPEKSFVCDVCGKAFNRRDNLRLHVKAVHMKIQTRKPRNPDSTRRGQTGGKRRIYGTELEDTRSRDPVPNYVPNLNLPSTSAASAASLPEVSGTSQQQTQFSSMDNASLDDASMDSKGSHTPSEPVSYHHAVQQLNLHMPNVSHSHAPAANPGQNIVEAALHFAHQNDFSSIQQPHLGFNFRGGNYR